MIDEKGVVEETGRTFDDVAGSASSQGLVLLINFFFFSGLKFLINNN